MLLHLFTWSTYKHNKLSYVAVTIHCIYSFWCSVLKLLKLLILSMNFSGGSHAGSGCLVVSVAVNSEWHVCGTAPSCYVIVPVCALVFKYCIVRCVMFSYRFVHVPVGGASSRPWLYKTSAAVSLVWEVSLTPDGHSETPLSPSSGYHYLLTLCRVLFVRWSVRKTVRKGGGYNESF